MRSKAGIFDILDPSLTVPGRLNSPLISASLVRHSLLHFLLSHMAVHHLHHLHYHHLHLLSLVVVVVITKPARAVASLHGDHVRRQSSRGLQEGCYCCPCGYGRSTCSGAGWEDLSTRGWVVGRASDRCDVALPCALGPLRQVW